MTQNQITVENLKEILDNLHHPERLETHPWVNDLFVQEAIANHTAAPHSSPGEILLYAVGKLFRQMMPSLPPKKGVRLDSRWGEFGILAARYFAPLIFGVACPTSLRDAWGKMDKAIQLFVFSAEQEISPEEAARYKLAADELEAAPNSTLSDWHRKGLERLTEIIQTREQFLSASAFQPSENTPATAGQTQANKKMTPAKRKPRNRIVGCYLPLILAAVVLPLCGFKAWQLYELGNKIWREVSQLRSLRSSSTSITLEMMEAAGPLLHILQLDLTDFRQETRFILWVGSGLHWVPVYGCDLASAQDLLDTASYLTTSADNIYQIAQSVLPELEGGKNLSIEAMMYVLVQNKSRILQASETFGLAQAARSRVDAGCLSPRLNSIIVEEIDPLMNLMEDGLSVAVALPELLGATDTGPKTYLLLAQNEDELRPTGGFITAAGKLVIKDGQIIDLSFEDSYNMDDFSKPYPLAPWQLDLYMNLRILLFRDSNWFSNYPTTALWVEYLYAYNRAHSVDGVIAFDQQMLVLLLEAIGPIDVDGEQITAKNVLTYMRESKLPPSKDILYSDWDRKKFLNPLASKIRQVVLTKDSLQLKALLNVLQRALNERHLLLQFDNPEISQMIARRGWDGAIRSKEGDFLMMVDANVGYSKTNAVVEGNVDYDVNLTDLDSPSAYLTVFRSNQAEGNPPCIMGQRLRDAKDVYYPIDKCYWNYLRVYVPKDTRLIEASPPPFFPDAIMVLNRSMPEPHVDIVDEEIENIQAFGTLMMVPGGQSSSAGFHFALPGSVLSFDSSSKQITYKLKIQKQPGTLAIPVTIRVHLPANATFEKTPATAIVQGSNLIFKTNLSTDIFFEIIFRRP